MHVVGARLHVTLQNVMRAPLCRRTWDFLHQLGRLDVWVADCTISWSLGLRMPARVAVPQLVLEASLDVHLDVVTGVESL